MEKILDFLVKKHSGLSFRKAAKAAGCSPTSGGKWWARHLELGRPLAELHLLTEDELLRLFRPRRGRSAKLMPDLASVHQRLAERHMTRTLLWEEYRLGDPGNSYSFQHYCELYAKFKFGLAISMRQLHEPGERICVDWAGTNIHWKDPSGKAHVSSLFASALGHSKYYFARACENEKSANWIECHNQMLEAFGGVSQLVVCDHLKTGVQKSGRQPVLNPVYAAWARHVGTQILPARVFRPQDKSAVEAGVGVLERWVITQVRNRTFDDLDHLNRRIGELVDLVNARPFRKLPGSRLSWFLERDKPALRPLLARFEFAEFGLTVRVPKDYHIMVKQHFYSVPHVLRHTEVSTRITATRVDIHQGERLVASHKRCDGDGGVTTIPEHRAPAHQAQAEATPDNHLAWAWQVGASTFAVMDRMMKDAGHPAAGGLAGSSLRNLARKHGDATLESACVRAVELNTFTITGVTAALRRLAAEAPTPPNLRGASYFGAGGNP